MTFTFGMEATCFLPGSELVVESVSLNPTRIGLLDTLGAMGAAIDIELDPSPEHRDFEPRGTVHVVGAPLRGVHVRSTEIVRMIDEIPMLAVTAAFAEGTTRIDGLSELRVKESDRLGAIVNGLRALGASVDTEKDDLIVHGRGGAGLRPAALETHGDHRMVMAWAVASLGVDGPCTIDHRNQVRISYPGFWLDLERLAS